MPSVSQHGKAEVERLLRSIVKRLDGLESWELGSYTLTESSSLSGDEVTLTLSLQLNRVTGSQTSGSGGKDKAGAGAASGSPGKGQRGGASRD